MADHAENTLDSDRNAEGKHQDEATGQRMAMEDASEKAKDIEADNDSAQADPKLVEQESLGEANEMKRVGDAADSAEAQSPESSHAEDSHFKVGKTVLVKVQGYPWWPAMLVTVDHFPQNAIKQKPNTKIRKDGSRTIFFPVQFLGDAEYQWAKKNDMKPLSKKDAQAWLDSGKKSATKGLKLAYLEAANPPSLVKLAEAKAKIEAAAVHVTEDEDMDDDDARSESVDESSSIAGDDLADEEDVELDDEGKPVKKSKGKSGTKKREPKTTNKTPSKTPTKRRKSEATEGQTSAKRAKSTPAKKGKSLKKSAPASPEVTPEESAKAEAKQREQSVFYLRHKLQKMLLSNKEPPSEDDLPHIVKCLAQLEETEVSKEIFANTKIGKVLSRIEKLTEIPRDAEFKIKEHASRILTKWKTIITGPDPNSDGRTFGISDPHNNGAAEDSGPADSKMTEASDLHKHSNGMDDTSDEPSGTRDEKLKSEGEKTSES